VDLTEILQSYQGRFKQRYAGRISHQQSNAMNAVLDCRSARYGSMALNCTSCDRHSLSYHACGNRACHRCQNYDTTQWLARQSQKLVPAEYFMVTFTLPRQLRSLARYHQRLFYTLLFECAKSTLQTFAKNHKGLGADVGMTMVLHTHTRRLDYHPHVHIIIPGICVNKRRKQCTKLRGKFLFWAGDLAKVFRARFLQAMQQSGFYAPAGTPKKWIADCRHVGKGLPALKYLSRYLYRGVISEKNILRDDGENITFGYVDSDTRTYQTRTLKGEEFLWLVYQHVLPKGFRRVRDYGFLHGNAKATLRSIHIALNVIVEKYQPVERPGFECKACGGSLNITRFIPPTWRSG